MNRDDQNRLADILEFAARLELYVAEGYEEFLAEDGSGRLQRRIGTRISSSA